jgi:hypothetical protein
MGSQAPSDSAGRAEEFLSPADIRRGRLIVIAFSCMAGVYAMVFGAASWLMRSPRLGAFAALALLVFALYSIASWLVISGRFSCGIRLFIAGVLSVVFGGTYVIRNELATWVIAAFIPFGIALQFTFGRTPLVAAAGVWWSLSTLW